MSIRGTWQLKHKISEREALVDGKKVSINHEITNLKGLLNDPAIPATYKVRSGRITTSTNLDLYSYTNSRNILDSMNGLAIRELVISAPITNAGTVNFNTWNPPNGFMLWPRMEDYLMPGACVQRNFPTVPTSMPLWIISNVQRYLVFSTSGSDVVDFVVVAGPPL